MGLVAGDQGFEPRLTDPESAVLPLDEAGELVVGITAEHRLFLTKAQDIGDTAAHHDDLERAAHHTSIILRRFNMRRN